MALEKTGYITPRTPPASRAPARRSVTLRSILLGVAVSTASSLWVNHIEYVVHASRQLTGSQFPFGVLMVYLTVALLLNPLCRLLSARAALSPSELLVVMACGLVGGTIPSVGLTGYLLGAIAAPYYFATPENQWADYFHPHIPEWLAPRNTDGALTYLFEGLPPGAPIPWSAWGVPLACWMALATALLTASVCLAVILRKQWVENERLTYPILRPVMDLTARSESLAFPRLFWVGFSVALGILSWNMISYFVPGFPEIPNIRWGPWVRFERYFPGIWTRVNMFIISFAYFANIDVLFSFWFFDLLFILRSGILNRLGFNASSWAHASPEFAWLPLGAFVALAFWSLWTSRHHLRAVLRKARGSEGALDESEEMMGYRAALLGLALSVAFVVFYLWRAGMGFGVACLFTLATLTLYIGVARVVSDVGLVFVCAPVGAQGLVTYAVGSQNLSASSLTALAFSNGLYAYGKGLFMPAVCHVARIADACPKPDRRRMLTGVFLAYAATAAATIAYTLYLGYTKGAYNFNDYPFNEYSQYGFSFALAQMKNPAPPDTARLFLFGIGAAAMSLLTFLKYRFAWWPLHPVGFALSDAATYMRYGAFSVFLAWAIKFLILRVGGATLYRTYQPFFLGILTGYTFGVTVSILVDTVWFPGAGHSIHGY